MFYDVKLKVLLLQVCLDPKCHWSDSMVAAEASGELVLLMCCNHRVAWQQDGQPKPRQTCKVSCCQH